MMFFLRNLNNIEFNIPASGIIKINIYDINGRVVSTLLKETKSTGEYSVTFSAAGLPNGVCFYELKTSEYSDVKKMLLLK